MEKQEVIGEDYSSRQTGSTRMEGSNIEEIRVDGNNMKSGNNTGRLPT